MQLVELEKRFVSGIYGEFYQLGHSAWKQQMVVWKRRQDMRVIAINQNMRWDEKKKEHRFWEIVKRRKFRLQLIEKIRNAGQDIVLWDLGFTTKFNFDHQLWLLPEDTRTEVKKYMNNRLKLLEVGDSMKSISDIQVLHALKNKYRLWFRRI